MKLKLKQSIDPEQTNMFLSSFGFVKLEVPGVWYYLTNVWISNGESVQAPSQVVNNYHDGVMASGLTYGLINGHIVFTTEKMLPKEHCVDRQHDRPNQYVRTCTPDGLLRVLQSGVVPRKVGEMALRVLESHTLAGQAEAKRKKEEARAAEMVRREKFLDNLGIFNKDRRDQIHQYLDKLDQFDWYYSFSDDMNVYRNGKRREDELKASAKELGMPELFEKAAVLYTYNR